MSDALPVLWVTGPSGVGKTTVGWKIYSELVQAGVKAAYLDVDQVGICSPDPSLDPYRYLTEARNVGAVLPNFQAAGAGCAIITGVVDPEHGVRADAAARAAVTVCRLRAEENELRDRLLARGRRPGLIHSVLREARMLDAGDVAGLRVDSSGLSADAVVDRVRELTKGWRAALPGPARPRVAVEAAPPSPAAGGTRVLWLYGVTAVGKSTVGFKIYERAAQAGRRTAYIDLGQVGILRPAPRDDPRNHRLKARNAGAIWRTFSAAGSQDLILVGALDSDDTLSLYATELEGASLSVCRLHAATDDLRRRIMHRGRGGSWPEPGDPLKGQTDRHLAQVAEEAAVESKRLDRAGIGGLHVWTDGLTAEETADAVVAATGWLR